MAASLVAASTESGRRGRGPSVSKLGHLPGLAVPYVSFQASDQSRWLTCCVPAPGLPSKPVGLSLAFKDAGVLNRAGEQTGCREAEV